jgi:NAD(P)-dependent dehydrogenase (short-subunit alcohol dehydrogenase family)
MPHQGRYQNFTGGLAQMLAETGIRANCVAPGPIWTPLLPRDHAGDTGRSRQAYVPNCNATASARRVQHRYLMLASARKGRATVSAPPLCGLAGGKPLI